MAKRYSVVIADRSTGLVRRLTVSLRPVLAVAAVLVALPMLIGLGARWSARTEIAVLRAENASLALENTSFREVTGALTDQITALQSAIAELSEDAQLDPLALKALNELPALARTRQATGGPPDARPLPPAAGLSAAFVSPDNAFGVLQEVLGVLEDRLTLVRTRVESRQALVAAIPSIWPTHGWLSDDYGRRRDPFTGGADFHPAVDISADRGNPVYATAPGTVVQAARSGAYGNLVVVDHGFSLTTRYGHLSRFAVRDGQQVNRGTVIGYVGATGRATGSHVHYEVWVAGRPVNPLKLLNVFGRQ
jgi:murein DD-endopeptidase MepM/ murein hydrolase activator NlpD